MSPLVRVEVIDRVMVVAMERAAKRNAINLEMARGLESAFDRFDDSPQLWVAILCGTPTVFSAGSDIVERADLRMPRGGEYGLIRRRRSKPVIAAVDGMALGGGMELALACDLIVAGADAQFGLPETRRGLVATSGALHRAPRRLPVNVARELLITGTTISARRAHDLGLVNVVTDARQAALGAMGVARSICESSPTSVRATLRAIDRVTASDEDDEWQITADAIGDIATSANTYEGLAAFTEKRPPRWGDV